MPKPLSIALVSGEIKPYSKTGGLADVTGALPGAFGAIGHEVRVFTPLHQQIDPKAHHLKRIMARVPVIIGTKTFHYNLWLGTTSGGQTIYFIDNYDFFKSRHKLYGYPKDGNLRYYFFDKAVLDAMMRLQYHPHIIHCHDWHAGLIPNLLSAPAFSAYFFYTATVMTIHNIAFQSASELHHGSARKRDSGKGLPKEDLASIRQLNMLLRGITYADVISTVSDKYAHEIQTPGFGCGLEKVLHKRRRRLFGILNGIDYSHFDPRYDTNLHVSYHLDTLNRKLRNKSFLQEKMELDQDDNIPLIGMATRITEQKGFDLLFEVIDKLMELHVQLAIVGAGETQYERKIAKYQKKYPGRLGAHLNFSEEVASWVYAGSDIFLMPSRFEPCGLGQMIALRYGTIPVVRKTGGLADTIIDYNPDKKRGNGFVFTRYNSKDMLATITRALNAYKYRDRWDKLMQHGMSQSYSWELPAKQYIKLFRLALQKRRKTPIISFTPDKSLIHYK